MAKFLGRGAIPLLGLLCWLSAGATARAHNPDTSYTRVQIEPGKLEIKLSFDLLTLLKMAPLDADGDRQVSREELRRQAPQIYDFLRRHIHFQLNDAPADIGESSTPVFSEDLAAVEEKDYPQTLAHFFFHRRLQEWPECFSLDYELFDRLGERHTNLALIEEAALHTEIIFTRFEPDYLYFTGSPPQLSNQLREFLRLGVKHIFLGYDHILFLLALIVVSRFKELVKIVTAFTVAHTITLILAALEIVQLPARLIEIAIALTIMYVAVENLWAKRTGHRWLLTFGFGLVHGFGFANVLRDLGLPTQGLVRCLIAFNLGVELGQLAIVLILLPLTWWLGKQPFGTRIAATLSIVIFLFGLAWFVERAFSLQFMPI